MPWSPGTYSSAKKNCPPKSSPLIYTAAWLAIFSAAGAAGQPAAMMVMAAALGFYTSGGSAPGLLLAVTPVTSAPCSHEAANVAGRSAVMGTELRDLVSASESHLCCSPSKITHLGGRT